MSIILRRRARLWGFSRVSLRESRCSFPNFAPRRVRPHARSTKKRPAEASRFNILWWAVRGSACFAGGRCGASRLARCAGKRLRVFSAPRPFGFDPMKVQQKKDGQLSLTVLTCFGGPSGGQPAAQAAAAAPRRLARCAGKCLRISSAPRPFGFDPLRGQQKSDQPEPVALTIFGGPSGGRTLDLGIKSPLLYQLS